MVVWEWLCVVVRCVAGAKVVESRLSDFDGDGPILTVDAGAAPPGAEPGDYALGDIRAVCGKMSEGLTKWANRSIDLMQRNLKRCPFCDGETRLEDADDFYGVECKRTETCGAQVFFDGVRYEPSRRGRDAARLKT